MLAALALGCGLALGGSGAIARELTDNAIHSVGDLEMLIDASVFAALPAAQPERSWYRRFVPAPRRDELALEAAAASDFALPSPQAPYVDALHRLRASLLLSRSDRAPQVIAILPVAPEGLRIPLHPGDEHQGYIANDSPSLALALGAVLAQHGASTLYVDANLRAAPIVGAFPVAPGLSDLLAGEQTLRYEHAASGPALLSVIHAGAHPPCPAELISSVRMASLLTQWRREFAFIVVDGPAAVYADALVLAQQADAVLLAVRSGATRRDEVQSAFHALSRQVQDHAVLGAVLESASRGGARARA